MKQKAGSLKKICKIDKLLTNLIRMRREKTQISKIGNIKGDITTNTTEIQGIIRGYLENLYSDKLENLEEMNKFLDIYDILKLSQEDINQLTRSIMYNEIEAVIKRLPKRKVQDLMGSQLNSTRSSKKK
jgi:hypothetical protein